MMKHLTKVLLALMVLMAASCRAQSYPVTDSFSGSGALSSSWTNTTVGYDQDSYPPVPLEQSSGKVVATPPGLSGTLWGMAIYTGATFSNDQYAQSVFVTASSPGTATGPCVRMSVGGNAYCYVGDLGGILIRGNGLWGGLITSSCPVPASGDVIKISAVGTTITCTDVTKGTSASAVDTTYWLAYGSPGLEVDQTSASASALSSFQADCIPTCSLGAASTPTFSPAAGSYTSAQTVTISSATSGATIYYTTNGATPTTSSAVYSTAISVPTSETVKAIAVKSGYTTSAIGSAAYSISSYPATDSFSGTGPLSANWTNTTVGAGLTYPPVPLAQASGKVVTNPTGNWGFALYTGETFTDDQYSQAKFVTHLTAGGGTGPCVRMNAANGNAYCYAADLGTIMTWNNGLWAAVLTSSCPIPSSGDIVQISAIGTTISCEDVTTGVSASVTDTTYWLATGNPGVLVDQRASTSYALSTYQADCIPSCGGGTSTVATPTFSPTGGSYSSTQTVTISSSTTGATIYYTTNGSTPTTSSAVYSSPISVATSETLKALAVKTGYTNSAIGSATYTIALTAATPTFSPGGGTYASAQTVTISTATSGATIHYTTDGSTPTPSSATYSGPITVSATETVKAIATETGYTNSAIGSATYTITPPGPGTTWYIRSDGGTRYSANKPLGQCDGKGDSAYPGSGVNQHCAYNDYRFLWDDQSYGSSAWVISGGDTVIIRNGPWRIGFDQGASPGDVWCQGGSGPTSCGNPVIPAGTPTQHTRILGENYASCGSKSQMTQLYGGFGLGTVIWLVGAQYVDVQCLELTRHSDCAQHGEPAYPARCSTDYPYDDFAVRGLTTSVDTHDVLLQDMWIHGFTDRGVIGALGGVVTALRVDISTNGEAGWDFDDGSGSNNGSGTASLPGAVWNFKDSVIEWSGCNQQYPATDAIPIASCFAQNNGGYGDGVGSPPGGCLTANIDGSTFRYNMQDAADLGHYDTSSCALTITNSTAYGNLGGTFKWGAAENPAIFENNLVIANGFRLSQPLTGLPSMITTSLAADLGDMCRAGDAVSFNFEADGVAVMSNNTVVNYCPTSFDIGCWASTNCSAASFTFQNNLVLGYDNPITYDYGGQPGGPGGIGYQLPIGTVVQSNNLFYGIRNVTCPTGNPGEICSSPLLVGQPTGTGSSFVESELDNFNPQPTMLSPIIGAGIHYTGIPATDYNGATRPNPPSIGAVE